MRTIAILNQKGGVGKTTSVANIAAGLAIKGKKVLMIDLDPQGHLTIHFGLDPASLETSVYHVLTQSMPAADAMIEVRENLCLLGANIDLVGAESELVDAIGREIILRDAVAEVADKFDYLIIDCPPSLGLLSLNALACVKEIFIPLQPHFLALQGLGKLLETVALVNKRINPQLRVAGVLFCMYDARTSLTTEVKNDIEQFLKASRNKDCPWSEAKLVPIHIRRNVKLAEAPSYGKTIYEYEPECNGAADYEAICDYIIEPASVIKFDEEPEPANADS